MLTRHFVVLLALAATGCNRSEKPEFLIAAAADLRLAMDEIVGQFQTAHPEVAVKTSYGSSGQFTSQIENGAPFDVFLSADAAYPRRLADEGLALAGSEFVYAIGSIVLWVPDSSPLQLTGVDALRDPSIRHIAIANPQHAPYGKAAEAALRSRGLYDQVKDKLVYGENVAQALQFVETGAAEIGIVSHSLVKGGRSWEVPRDAYPKMEQGGIIVKSSRHAALAQEFRTFLLSEQGRSILKRFGFYLPV
jgi:molybdate transport system substrate-binding protein